jgi:hypothetical protein
VSFLCRLGIHRRYKPGRHIWLCWGCKGMWKRCHDDRAQFRWEKVR